MAVAPSDRGAGGAGLVWAGRACMSALPCCVRSRGGSRGKSLSCRRRPQQTARQGRKAGGPQARSRAVFGFSGNYGTRRAPGAGGAGRRGRGAGVSGACKLCGHDSPLFTELGAAGEIAGGGALRYGPSARSPRCFRGRSVGRFALAHPRAPGETEIWGAPSSKPDARPNNVPAKSPNMHVVPRLAQGVPRLGGWVPTTTNTRKHVVVAGGARAQKDAVSAAPGI